jgi:hypothetical protein
MKHTSFFCAVGALALAGSGCAYQGAGHGSYGSYGSHSSSYSTPYYGGCNSSYTPQGCATVGGTRVEVDFGAERFVDGNIIDGGIVSGGNTTSEVGYADAFKPGYRASVGLARDYRPNTTVMAKGFYKSAEGEDGVTIATNGGGNVTANFSDYESYGAEVGLRQYLSPAQTRLRPFVGATVGATYIDDISIDNGGPAFLLNEAGWSATASATGGFEMPISQTASLALESGIRWEGSQDRAAAATPGFGEDNSRLSVPVTLRGRFRF